LHCACARLGAQPRSQAASAALPGFWYRSRWTPTPCPNTRMGGKASFADKPWCDVSCHLPPSFLTLPGAQHLHRRRCRWQGVVLPVRSERPHQHPRSTQPHGGWPLHGCSRSHLRCRHQPQL
jgi:hypothetical protein